MFYDLNYEPIKPSLRLSYPKKLGITKKQVLHEKTKMHNPDLWEYSSTKTSHILKFNKAKAREKLENGTFKSSNLEYFNGVKLY